MRRCQLRHRPHHRRRRRRPPLGHATGEIGGISGRTRDPTRTTAPDCSVGAPALATATAIGDNRCQEATAKRGRAARAADWIAKTATASATRSASPRP